MSRDVGNDTATSEASREGEMFALLEATAEQAPSQRVVSLLAHSHLSVTIHSPITMMKKFVNIWERDNGPAIAPISLGLILSNVSQYNDETSIADDSLMLMMIITTAQNFFRRSPAPSRKLGLPCCFFLGLTFGLRPVG